MHNSTTCLVLWEGVFDGEKVTQPFRSDHSVMWAEFEQPVKRRLEDNRGDHRQLNLKGWIPKDQAALNKFRHDTCRGLLDLVSSNEASTADTSIAANLEKAENLIATAARAAACHLGNGGIARRPRCPRLLTELEREASKVTTTPEGGSSGSRLDRRGGGGRRNRQNGGYDFRSRAARRSYQHV